MSWTTANLGSHIEAFMATGGYQEWKNRLDAEYESVLNKLKGGSEYHEYQWLIGKLSGIELAHSVLNELVIDGTEAGKNIVG